MEGRWRAGKETGLKRAEWQQRGRGERGRGGRGRRHSPLLQALGEGSEGGAGRAGGQWELPKEPQELCPANLALLSLCPAREPLRRRFPK